jgi:hypothetical protein
MPSPSHTGGIEGLITKLTCREGERVWTFLCNIARNISNESQQNLPGHPPPTAKDSREGGRKNSNPMPSRNSLLHALRPPAACNWCCNGSRFLTGIDGVMQGFGGTPCPFWELKPGRARVAANQFPVISGALVAGQGIAHMD